MDALKNPHARENELVLLSARPGLDDDDVGRIEQLLGDDIDWTYLIRSALLHKVTPGLGATLKGIGEPLVPSDILYAIDVHLDQNQQRIQASTNETLSLANAFADRGIAVLPYKGAAMLSGPYDSLALREAEDPAFLVHPEDIPALLLVLTTHGYRRRTGDGRPLILSSSQDTAFRRYHTSYRYYRAEDGLSVETHWGIGPRTAAIDLDYDALWRRATTVDIAGTNILSFAVEDLILILCVLGAIAEWRELRLIADVAHAIRQRGHLDFELLLERAQKQGCGRFVLTALELVRRQFNMEVPDLASSDNRTVDRLSGLLIGTLFDADTRKSDIFSVTRTQLRLRERARDRLRYLARTALTPRIEHLKIIDLPAKLSWGYSVIKLCYDYVASPLGYPKRLIDNPGSGLPPAELAHAKANAKAQWQARSGAWERWAPSLISRSDLNDALIAAAHPATGYRMLDLACGVGDTSLALSPIVGPQGLVASTDLVVDMVEGARRRARGADLANMIFCVADMEALPYQDGSFDGVVCRLGIMYCPRVQLAFSEGRRVLKPGAHAAYLVCGLMENNPILAVTHNVIHELFALEADGDTPAPFRFGAKGSLAPLMIEAGFTEVEERELSSKRVAPKGTGFWHGGAERGLGIALESLPPDTYAELVRRMETAFAPYLKDDAYYFEHHSRVGIGRCPMPRRQG